MMTDINESILMSVLDPPLTHQPAVYQLRLPRENPCTLSPIPSAVSTNPCFSKSQDERLARWCFYSTLL